MADGGGGGNTGLGLIVGALLVAVLVIGFVVFNGGGFGAPKKSVEISVNTPKIEAPELPKAPAAN